MHLVVIGGSDAGIAAALRAREIDPNTMVTVLLADGFPNYSICGLPFFLSREVSDPAALAHRTREELESTGIELLINTTAKAIGQTDKTVVVVGHRGHQRSIQYDRLIIATGARPTDPGIIGHTLPGVFYLHTMEDSLAIDRFVAETKARRAFIVGGGYIGLEMADALTLRGIEVTLASKTESVLPSVDPELGRSVEEELRRHGVIVHTQTTVRSISPSGSTLNVMDAKNRHHTTDMVVLATGVRPSSELARSAGIQPGHAGAIRVNRRMETNITDIFAAGDCVETWHRLLARSVYRPLGTTAHKQGRIAGENAVGGNCEFAGTLGTQVVKVFELAIARTGLSEVEANHDGWQAATVKSTMWDHKVYYPGAMPMHICVVGDRSTGQLLGAQMIGYWKSEVAKRIDIIATALFHGMTVDGVNDLDLSYTPPLSSPWDPVQIAAQAWLHQYGNQPASADSEART